VQAHEIVPPPGGFLVASAQRVRVNIRSHPDRGVSQPFRYRRQIHAIRQQERSVGMTQSVQAGPLGQTETPAKQRYCRGNRIGLQRRAIGIREDQIQVRAVIRAVLRAELILLPAVRLQGCQNRCGQLYSSRFLCLRALKQQDLPGLRKRSRNHYLPALLDIGPSQRQNLTTARSSGGRHLQEHRQAPGAGRGFDQQHLLRRHKRHSFVFFWNWWLAAGDRVGRDQSPFDGTRKSARQHTGGVADRLR
jgi:hypothetical protein